MTCKSAVWLTVSNKTKQQIRSKALIISCLKRNCVFKHLSQNSLLFTTDTVLSPNNCVYFILVFLKETDFVAFV